MHFACANKNSDLIKMLLQMSPRQFALKRNIYGATPLHWLVHGVNIPDDRKLKLVKTFRTVYEKQHGIESYKDMLRQENALGLTPLDWLEIYKQTKSYLFLKEDKK